MRNVQPVKDERVYSQWAIDVVQKERRGMTLQEERERLRKVGKCGNSVYQDDVGKLCVLPVGHLGFCMEAISTTTVAPTMEAIKQVMALHYSEGKEGVDQIPAEVLLEVGKVYAMGAKKYGRDNWKKGQAWHEFYGSALRHIYKFWGKRSDNDCDVESGLHELDHAIWNLITLRYYVMHELGVDDR